MNKSNNLKYQYHGIFGIINRINAVNIIKKSWLLARYNPCYKLCFLTESRNIDEIFNSIFPSKSEKKNTQKVKLKTPSLTPTLKQILLNNRKKDFVNDLNKTKVYLENNKKKIEYYTKYPLFRDYQKIKWKLNRN